VFSGAILSEGFSKSYSTHENAKMYTSNTKSTENWKRNERFFVSKLYDLTGVMFVDPE